MSCEEEYEMSYEEYEKKCDEIRIINERYLKEFEDDLLNSGLKEKTVKKHFFNVDFYINTFLLREMPLEMTSGAGDYVNDFLGYFFIRKCMWSTPSTIKSNAASIKKFYKSMFERGYIEKSNYEELLDTIEDNMEFWLEDCESYNDPNSPNPFSLF